VSWIRLEAARRQSVIAWTRQPLAAATAVGAKQQMGEANLEMTRQMKNAGLQTDGMVRYATMAATSCGVDAFKKFADDSVHRRAR
jgi:hypothetical protein